MNGKMTWPFHLSLMVGSSNRVIKSLQTRLLAFQRGNDRAGRRSFAGKYHRHPRSLEELFQKGYLKEFPVDPYGGKFYIDEMGKVRSTSKFAFGVAEKNR
jgi:hypothetical protein